MGRWIGPVCKRECNYILWRVTYNPITMLWTVLTPAALIIIIDLTYLARTQGCGIDIQGEPRLDS